MTVKEAIEYIISKSKEDKSLLADTKRFWGFLSDLAPEYKEKGLNVIKNNLDSEFLEICFNDKDDLRRKVYRMKYRLEKNGVAENWIAFIIDSFFTPLGWNPPEDEKEAPQKQQIKKKQTQNQEIQNQQLQNQQVQNQNRSKNFLILILILIGICILFFVFSNSNKNNVKEPTTYSTELINTTSNQQEARLRAEQEAKLKAEEARLRAEQEAKLKAEEAKARAEQEAKLRAEEAKARAEQEAKLRAEEAKARAEQKAKLRAEEAKLRAQQEAKLRAQQEAKLRAQQEAKLRAQQEARRNPFKNAKVGDYIKFGNYPQTADSGILPIEWQVLSRENNQMLVISCYGLEARRFDSSSNNWSNSEIRNWLNCDFYNKAFSAQEKKFIKSSNLSDAGTSDNVFLLSKREAKKYFARNYARKCKATDYAVKNGAWVAGSSWGNSAGYSCWCLRSPDPYISNGLNCVAHDGSFGDGYVYINVNLARPALWINL